MSAKPDLKAPHWSASRFMLFEQCPRLYRDRYVDGVATEPSLAMLFGHSVHTALEALHQGHRGVCLDAYGAEGHERGAYREARTVYTERFDAMTESLRDLGLVAPASLYVEGLKMINLVEELALNSDARSEPEHWFTLPTESTWGLPTIGAVDLWSPPWSKHGPVVWDFKTTVGSWGPERAVKERWQPMLYAWAYKRAFAVLPTFRYLVLSRVSGNAEAFDRTWSPREWKQDFSQLHFHAEEIAEAVAQGRFDCERGHGTCLECGAAYGHDHVCADASRPIRAKIVKHRGQTWVQPALDLAVT
jgi:hypothetical protein